MDKLTFWTTSSVPLCCPMRIFPDELKNWGTAIQVLGCGCLWSWGTFYSILQKAPEKESLETPDQGGFVSLNDPCLLAFPISAPWLLFCHSVTLLVVLVSTPCFLSSPLLPLPTPVRECVKSQASLVWPIKDLSSFGCSQPKKFLLFQFLSIASDEAEEPWSTLELTKTTTS